MYFKGDNESQNRFLYQSTFDTLELKKGKKVLNGYILEIISRYILHSYIT